MSSSIKNKIIHHYRNGGMHMKLLYINLIVFFIFTTILIFSKLMMWGDENTLWFYNQFSFQTDLYSLIKHPWGIISYMFIHECWHPVSHSVVFNHIFFNMLILFFVGKIFEQHLGKKKLLSTYIIGGICGAALHFVSVHCLPELNQDSLLLGSSASVFAIFIAIGFYDTKLEVNLFGVFKIRLIILACIFLLLEYFRLANTDDDVAHFAHLGGAIWGFIFISNLKKGKDLSLWFDKTVSFLVRLSTPKKKIKIVWNKKQKTNYKSKPPRDDYDYNANKKERQDRVDEILDKIKASGYDSLTKAEKDFLFDASKNI